MASGGLRMIKDSMTRARAAEVPLPDFGMPATEPLLPPSSTRGWNGCGHAWTSGATTTSWSGPTGSTARSGLPHRLRSPVRGGRAHRRAGGPAGHPPRQRVLRHGGGRTAADAAGSVPGPEPAEPAPGRLAVALGDPRGHRGRAGSASWAGRPTRGVRPWRRRPSGRRAQELTGASGMENATDLLIDPADGLRVPSTKSSSSRPSSGRRARRRARSAPCSVVSAPG